MLLLDVSEESRIGEVPFAARAAEFAFCLFFAFDVFDLVGWAFLLTH